MVSAVPTENFIECQQILQGDPLILLTSELPSGKKSRSWRLPTLTLFRFAGTKILGKSYQFVKGTLQTTFAAQKTYFEVRREEKKLASLEDVLFVLDSSPQKIFSLKAGILSTTFGPNLEDSLS